ncbi:MAG: hypothetical protein ISS88_01950 [Candidatus Portnoybacteria bacterium]|nr:hypothetical protein [Candidatus Portnoybacteria bacterium]
MNIFEKEPQQESLEDFQQEIKELQDKELEMKRAADKPESVGNPDLLNIEIEKLTPDDMKAWQNYKKLTIDNITEKDIQDFNRYKDLTYSDKESSRGYFAAFLADKLTILWGKKQLKEIRK